MHISSTTTKERDWFGEKQNKMHTQPGACCQSFLLLFYYTKIFWCHRPYKKKKIKNPPVSPTPAQLIEYRNSMLLFSALPKEWTSCLHWQIFSSCLNSWKLNRLGSVEVYTVRKGHGSAVPRRNRIAGLVFYKWKQECLFLWGLCTDKTIKLSHVGEKEGGLLLLRFLKIQTTALRRLNHL